MQLLVSIGIFKVIFCRLMILCTQYSPMSVFFVSASYWFHSVSGGSTCQHLRWCSLWQLLLLIFYSFGQATGLSYEFLAISCANLFLNASRSKWFHLVTGCSSSFHMVPARSRLFQVVPACSSLFLLLLCAYFYVDF